VERIRSAERLIKTQLFKQNTQFGIGDSINNDVLSMEEKNGEKNNSEKLQQSSKPSANDSSKPSPFSC
jgi:hypothetical protein